MKKWAFAVLMCLMATMAFAQRYVDSRGANVPAKYDTDMKTLVDYLVEPYQKDDEKARVILAWIVNHIDYDQYRYNKMMNNAPRARQRRQNELTSGDIWETRIGVCEDIAKLYQRMALMAGLDAVTIGGYAGYNVTRDNMSDFRHMWNAVKINGNWEFVDPTWAIQGDYKVGSNIVSDRRHQKEIEKRADSDRASKGRRRNRDMDDRWFMTKPSEMIKTHFPDDSTWQLLPRPRSFASYLN